MATLRALLDIYGSLDAAVIESRSPRVAAIADRFLPGASANPGWYHDIEDLMFVGDEARTTADPVRGLQEIRDDRAEGAPAPTVPELSRLVFGLGAVLHLNSVVPLWPLPRPDDPRPQGTATLLAEVLALAGPADLSDDVGRVEELLPQVLEVFTTEFTGQDAWSAVAEQLQAMGVLSADVAAVPPCQAAVVEIDGVQSVVVDTEFTSADVSLNALKAVVDPRNWCYNYRGFFCDMRDKGVRPDKWRKVLEFVGFCAFPDHISPRLRTMLKFHKLTGPAEARLDYDLSDPAPDPEGDGKITVDRGFINMWAPDGDPTQPPVTVRTRKVAHINGVDAYTQQRYVCTFGYGNAAMEMLFGPAKNPDPTVSYYPWEDADQPTQTQPAPGQPANTVASTAFTMLAACTTDISAKNLALAEKWMAGKLTFADLASHSADIGARIASDPWKFMQAISHPNGGGA